MTQLYAYYVSQLEKVSDLVCRIQIIVPAMCVAVIFIYDCYKFQEIQKAY